MLHDSEGFCLVASDQPRLADSEVITSVPVGCTFVVFAAPKAPAHTFH